MLYKKDLINLLDTSGCDYFIKEHEALYTVEDSKALRGTISGAHSKNLFLKENPKIVLEMGENSRKLAENVYDKLLLTNQFLDVIKSNI